MLAVFSEPDAAMTLLDFQLVTLAGAGAGEHRPARAPRAPVRPPLRRSVALLVDSFMFALVMMAALLVMGAFFVGEGFLWVQRATFVVLGLAPVAFLFALLDARLARSSVGDLLLELRSDPTPGELREPIARALNDPSLELAYWLPQFGSWTDSGRQGGPAAPRGDGQATTVIDRGGEHVAALIHDPIAQNEPELLDAVGAAAIARERPPARRAAGASRGAGEDRASG